MNSKLYCVGNYEDTYKHKRKNYPEGNILYGMADGVYKRNYVVTAFHFFDTVYLHKRFCNFLGVGDVVYGYVESIVKKVVGKSAEGEAIFFAHVFLYLFEGFYAVFINNILGV